MSHRHCAVRRPDQPRTTPPRGGGRVAPDLGGRGSRGGGAGVGETRATRWALRPPRCGAVQPSQAGAAVSGASAGIGSGHSRHQTPDTLPPGGSPPLQSGGAESKVATSGQGGYIAPAARGVPTAAERAAASEVADKWAHCLQACIFSKIGNSFFAVRSCNFFIFEKTRVGKNRHIV